jgi:hypothetical protein
MFSVGWHAGVVFCGGGKVRQDRVDPSRPTGLFPTGFAPTGWLAPGRGYAAQGEEVNRLSGDCQED